VARPRIPTSSGRRVVLYGSLFGQRKVAVILEPALAPEIAPLIVEAYGLTGRERDVTRLVL
jgi:hypothetical protein